MLRTEGKNTGMISLIFKKINTFLNALNWSRGMVLFDMAMLDPQFLSQSHMGIIESCHRRFHQMLQVQFFQNLGRPTLSLNPSNGVG